MAANTADLEARRRKLAEVQNSKEEKKSKKVKEPELHDASSNTKYKPSKGKGLFKSTASKVLALAVAGIMVIGAAVAVWQWADNAKGKGDAEVVASEMAERYFNSSEGLVAGANSNLTNADTVLTEAENKVEFVQDGFVVSFSLEDNVSDMENKLEEAQTAMTTAKEAFEDMTTLEDGKNAVETLKNEYNAKNYDKVNEIGAQIEANSKIVNEQTKVVTENATAINVAYTATVNEFATTLYTKTIPNLTTIVNSNVKDSEEAAKKANDIFNIINATSASQEFKDSVKENRDLAEEYNNKVLEEKEIYDTLNVAMTSAYNAKAYVEAANYADQMMDSASIIEEYSEAAVNYNYTANETYQSYLEEENETIKDENESLNQSTFDVEFTAGELKNYAKSLVGPELKGKVVGVEKCTYSKTGEVSIIVNCTDMKGNPYTNLITGNITAGLSKDEVNASVLMDRLTNSGEKVNYQEFGSTLDIVSKSNSNASLIQGTNSVSGDLDIKYSIDAKYNGETGYTAISAHAIAVIRDSNGEIVAYKVYSTPKEYYKGNDQAKYNEKANELKNDIIESITNDDLLQADYDLTQEAEVEK